jgi:hypothetical protein
MPCCKRRLSSPPPALRRMWLMVSGDQAYGRSEFSYLSDMEVIVSLRNVTGAGGLMDGAGNLSFVAGSQRSSWGGRRAAGNFGKSEVPGTLGWGAGRQAELLHPRGRPGQILTAMARSSPGSFSPFGQPLCNAELAADVSTSAPAGCLGIPSARAAPLARSQGAVHDSLLPPDPGGYPFGSTVDLVAGVEMK